MSTDGDSIRLTNPRRVAPKKTWKNKNDDKIIFDNTMFKKHKRQFNNANSYNGSNNNTNNNNNINNIGNNIKETSNNNNNKNNSNNTNNNNKNNSFNTNMVQINNTIAPNSNTRDSPRRPFANRTIKGGARPYRSTRPQTQNNNNNNKEDENKSNNINNGHYNSNKNRFSPKKKAKKKKNNTIVIEKEQLTALVAGDHVEITTKHNQIIDGIVYCSIPQVPPLCIIHHYNPERTKNVYVVALHEISRCIKFDELSQERNVELRPINDENANEILERNLAERKAKMETLNISVDDLEQELFDFLYRTLPNKCEWSGNNITFPHMKIIIMQPYKKLSLNGVTKKNKSVQYVETQLNSFWLKQQQKSNTKTLQSTSPRSPPSSNSSKSTPKKKKKKKKSKAAKNQNKHKNKSKNNNVNTNTQKNKNNLLQQQTPQIPQILQQFSSIPATAAPINQFNVNANVNNPVIGQPPINNNLMNMSNNIINQQLLNNIMNQQINNNAMAQQIDPQQQQLNNLLLSLPVQSNNALPNPLNQFTQFQAQIAPQQQLNNNNNPQQQQLNNKNKDNKQQQQQQQQVAPRMRRGGGRGNRGRNSNRGNRPHQRGRGGHDRRNHGQHNRNRGRGRNNNRGRGRGRGRGRERDNNHHNQQNINNQGIGRGRNQSNTHNMQQNEIINNISINNQ